MTHWKTLLKRQMANAGLSNKDDKPSPYDCEAGHLIEYVWTQQDSFGYWAKPECQACEEAESDKLLASRRLKRLEIARVPRLLLGATTDALAVDGFNKHVRDVLSGWRPPAWVTICGPVGTGKTTWLTAHFNRLAEQGGDWAGAMWTTESSLFEACDIAHADNGYTARQKKLRSFCSAPLLMIDDIGAGRAKLTEWQNASMRHLFDVRHANGMPTFLTTNMRGQDAFANRYGEHVASRVIQASNGFASLGGPDRRLHEPGRSG